MLLTLRDYQVDCVNKYYNSVNNGFKSPLMVQPTGAGKTVIFCHIAEQLSKQGKIVYILVHRKELIHQTCKKLDTFGVRHGVIAPKHSLTCESVQVASVYTLANKLDILPVPDLIIVDEAHHATAGTWKKILTKWYTSNVLGVTATPLRRDGIGLGINSGGFFDDLVLGPSTSHLINHGYLSDYSIYAPPTDIDFTKIRKLCNEYRNDDLIKEVDKPKITGCAVEHYSKICPGVPAICFCVSINHANNVAKLFSSAGWIAHSIDGTMTDSEREGKIKSLGNGEINVLTCCEIINEGTDIPIVGAGILLRPTMSLGLYLQQIGRVLRPHENKERAFILDHVGNCLRHGMPDDERTWSLEGRQYQIYKRCEEETRNTVKVCDKCYLSYKINLLCCPSCGNINKTGREVKQVSGELKELTSNRRKFYKEKIEGGDLKKHLFFASFLGLPGDIAYRSYYIKKGLERNRK